MCLVFSSQVVSGGVASNQYLRSQLESLTSSYGYSLHCPPPRLCTDNGVMIAWSVTTVRLPLIPLPHYHFYTQRRVRVQLASLFYVVLLLASGHPVFDQYCWVGCPLSPPFYLRAAIEHLKVGQGVVADIDALDFQPRWAPNRALFWILILHRTLMTLHRMLII